MDLNQIIEFIGKREVAVYGAGILGEALAEILAKHSILVRTYIVSDGQNTEESMKKGIPVKNLSDWVSGYDKNKVSLLVSMSNYYKPEIESNLKNYGINDYLWVDRDLFPKMIREIRPVASNEMLISEEPVSRSYGSERGKPIDRYYIENFLQEETDKLQYAQNVLEVGEDTYSKKYFPNASRWDILDYRQGMDLTKQDTLPEACYDVFICTQTFNFIYDVKAAIMGAYHVLRYGGIMLATVMGQIAQISSNDMKRWGDYWRFTKLGIEKLVGEVFDDGIKVMPFGNAPIATAWVQGLCLEDLPDKSLLDISDETYTINIGICARKKIEDVLIRCL